MMPRCHVTVIVGGVKSSRAMVKRNTRTYCRVSTAHCKHVERQKIQIRATATKAAGPCFSRCRLPFSQQKLSFQPCACSLSIRSPATARKDSSTSRAAVADAPREGGGVVGNRGRKAPPAGRSNGVEPVGDDQERGGSLERPASDTASAASDINYMHESLRQYQPEEGDDGDEEGVGDTRVHHDNSCAGMNGSGSGVGDGSCYWNRVSELWSGIISDAESDGCCCIVCGWCSLARIGRLWHDRPPRFAFQLWLRHIHAVAHAAQTSRRGVCEQVSPASSSRFGYPFCSAETAAPCRTRFEKAARVCWRG